MSSKSGKPMAYKLSDEIRLLAETLSERSFKALSSGIAIQSSDENVDEEICIYDKLPQALKNLPNNNYSKNAKNPNSEQLNKKNVNADYPVNKTTHIFPINKQKKKRNYFLIRFSKLIAKICIDIIFVISSTLSLSVFFYWKYESQQIELTSWINWFYGNFLSLFPLKETLLGFLFLTILYGLLFRALLGATVGESLFKYVSKGSNHRKK